MRNNMQTIKERLLREIESLSKQIKIKNEELSNVEKLIDRENDNKPFFPIEGDKYYYVTGDSEVFETVYISNTNMDKVRVKNGNCFRTEEKAKEYAQKVLDVFSDRLNRPHLKITDNDFEMCRGYLGEEVPHITYDDGSIAHVGDVVSVQTGYDNDICFIFKDLEDGNYPTGAIMGFATATSNSANFNYFKEKNRLRKIKDYSEIEAGFKYSGIGTRYIVVEEEK